jgi:membrane-bound lytic murein transglycosylase A
MLKKWCVFAVTGFLSGSVAVAAASAPGPSSLVRVSGPNIPRLEIDDVALGSQNAGSREGLLTAVDRQLTACDRQPEYWNFAGKKVHRRRWCTGTLRWFRDQLEAGQSLNEILLRAREKLEWYRSTGKPGSGEVQFTGYFYPVHPARKKKDSRFRYPVYRLPPESLRRLTREQIESKGALRGRGLEIAYLDNPVDPFILQVQGSGALMIEGEDGNTERLIVNYGGTNGQPYVSIGRLMREAGVPEEFINLQGIRKYFIELHPEKWARFSNQNPSYVYFKRDEEGPYGSAATLLTPKHSIAVDKAYFPMGAMALIQTERPDRVEGGNALSWKPFSQFAVAQDTGGAIKTPGRVDVYWGEGDYAEVAAGRTDRLGQLFFVLLPE